MSKLTWFHRWLAAIGIVAGPFLILVLGELLKVADYESAEVQFRAIATQPTGMEYAWLLMQVLGAILLIPAAIGIMRIVMQRRRGLTLGYLGGAFMLLAALGGLVALGMELAQFFALINGADKDAMVQLALAINAWPLFGAFLMAFLAGFPIGLLLAIIAFMRTRLLPVWALALLLVPVVAGLLPLPGGLGADLALVSLMALPIWMAWAMLRRPAGDAPQPAPA